MPCVCQFRTYQELLDIIIEENPPHMYSLSDVLGVTSDNCEGHSISCDALGKWLCFKSRRESAPKIRRVDDKSLGYASADPLWVSRIKRADVAWHVSELVLQFEVVSNYDLEKTSWR